MNKLIELLNEYDSGWDYDDYYGPYQYGQDRDAYKYGKYYLVNRDYGFIKWLVEKDKIQYARIPEHRYVSDHCEKCIYEGMTDNVLMWLAISDTPINDLISYLK